MKTIQLTLDDDLLDRVNYAIAQQQTSLALFIKESLIHYLHKLKIKEMEKQHHEGYSRQPVQKDEFDIWEKEPIRK